MNPEWITLRRLADDYLLEYNPEKHALTRKLDECARAWAKDLDEWAKCQQQLAEARAAREAK